MEFCKTHTKSPLLTNNTCIMCRTEETIAAMLAPQVGDYFESKSVSCFIVVDVNDYYVIVWEAGKTCVFPYEGVIRTYSRHDFIRVRLVNGTYLLRHGYDVSDWQKAYENG